MFYSAQNCSHTHTHPWIICCLTGQTLLHVRSIICSKLNVLTSAGICLDILHAPNGRMVAVGDERRNRVQQAVHVACGPRVTKTFFQRPQPPEALLVLHRLHTQPYLTSSATKAKRHRTFSRLSLQVITLLSSRYINNFNRFCYSRTIVRTITYHSMANISFIIKILVAVVQNDSR